MGFMGFKYKKEKESLSLPFHEGVTDILPLLERRKTIQSWREPDPIGQPNEHLGLNQLDN
ncbi:hypothetical protein FRX31_008649 [Thalictrum thalictroides]|uniref:Uncharacterized protein n=1 Tax=Thalictrum thalictroides TaxID=46969 RepID=A0A7J6WXI0_THATH|nr:hypothetical protein FRX31_008649 [Thalictrum thalictroides]